MMEPRLSTVYDYSNLRLHPDGSRVYQNTTNRRPGLAQVTALDSRANWIAKDAGSSARVSKLLRNRKKVVEKEEENVEENIDILRGLSGGGGEEESGSDFEKQPEAGPSTVRGKKRKAARKTDGRTIKRRKFQTDYGYLSQNANSRSTSVEVNAQVNDAGLPAEPSPDLLKCIHRFASEFYDERGQLLNISRHYRQERKLRRLAKAQRIAQGKGKASLSKSTSRSNSDSEGEFDELSKEDDREKRRVKRSEEGHDDVSKNDDDEIDEERQEMTAGVKDGKNLVEGDVGHEDENAEAPNTEDDESQKGVRKTKKKRKPRILPPLVTDMYKVFDGSALLALGMLVQEHVAFLLTPQIPEGWNEDVKGAYSKVTPSTTEDIEDNEDRSEDDDGKDDELDGGRIQEDVHEKDETSEGGSTDEDQDEEQDSEDEDTNDQDVNEDEDETKAIDIAKGGGKEDDQDRPTKHIRPHNNQKAAEAVVTMTSDNDTSIGASSDEESRSQDTADEKFI